MTGTLRAYCGSLQYSSNDMILPIRIRNTACPARLRAAEPVPKIKSPMLAEIRMFGLHVAKVHVE